MTCSLLSRRSCARPSSIRPEVPASLDRIVRRAMHKDAAKRYSSGDEFAEDLIEARRAGLGAAAQEFSEQLRPCALPLGQQELLAQLRPLFLKALQLRLVLTGLAEVGIAVRQAQERGEEVPAELRAAFDQAEESLYKNVRALFGGRMRYCASGAAPIGKEILEFFYACGVPVLEG